MGVLNRLSNQWGWRDATTEQDLDVSLRRIGSYRMWAEYEFRLTRPHRPMRGRERSRAMLLNGVLLTCRLKNDS